MADNLTTFMCWLSWNLGSSASRNPQTGTEIALLFTVLFIVVYYLLNYGFINTLFKDAVSITEFPWEQRLAASVGSSSVIFIIVYDLVTQAKPDLEPEIFVLHL
jgi:hypothetical protein